MEPLNFYTTESVVEDDSQSSWNEKFYLEIPMHVQNAHEAHEAKMSMAATVLSRTWAAGVNQIIVIGGSLEESREAFAVVETDEFMLERIKKRKRH